MTDKEECDHMKMRIQLLQEQFAYVLNEYRRITTSEVYLNLLKRLDEIVITKIKD